MAGFGDIIFSIKFFKYLVRTFINIEIIYIVEKRSHEFIIKLKDHNLPKVNISLLLCDIIVKEDTNVMIYDKEIDCDILFISPKTNGTFDLKFKNKEDVLNNTYTLSEYNPINHAVSTINTGVGNLLKFKKGDVKEKDEKLSGLLLNNIRSTPIIIKSDKKYYSVCYFYLDKENLRNVTILPNSLVKFGDHSLTETILKLFKVDITKLSDEKKEEFLRETMSILSLLKFTLCYQEYLLEIQKIKDLNNVNINLDDVNIHIKYDNYLILKKFVDTIKGDVIEFFNLTFLKEKIGKLNIIKLEKLEYNNFLELLQYSLPVVFLTGDQSITDFISIHKDFKYSIFYQIFDWKKPLASKLMRKKFSEFAACGEINKKMLNTLKKNIKYDFRFNGLILVQSILIYCLQYSLNKTDSKIKLCESISKNTEKIISKISSEIDLNKNIFNTKITTEKDVINCFLDNKLSTIS